MANNPRHLLAMICVTITIFLISLPLAAYGLFVLAKVMFNLIYELVQ